MLRNSAGLTLSVFEGHTPESWRMIRPHSYDKCIYIKGPSVEVDYDDVDPSEAKANGRLIAAAPDLLNACRRMRALLGDAAEELRHYVGYSADDPFGLGDRSVAVIEAIDALLVEVRP